MPGRDTNWQRTEGMYLKALAIDGNIGTALLSLGQSSVVVPHGLSGTPGIVLLSPMGPLVTANRFWFSAPTATTFTLNTDVVVGAAVLFAWLAIRSI